MDNLDGSRVFVVPPVRSVHDQYTFRTEKVDNGPSVWNSVRVIVMENHEDGRCEDIFEYVRNYSMLRTFEPFRQLRDGKWFDYALISSQYTTFQVVDLKAREIVATNPYPVVTQEMFDRYPEGSPVGTVLPGSGFCPVGFKVFEWNKFFTPDDILSHYKDSSGNVHYHYDVSEFKSVTGQWGLVSGCVWGDDSSNKVQYIDLSRISEGIVSSDDRFGYVELFKGLDEIGFEPEGETLIIPTFLSANIKTGESYRLYANWAK